MNEIPMNNLTAPPRLPLRFWILIEAAVITIDQAVAEWRRQEAAGVPFDL